jgi:hypothetical protein
MKTKRMTGEQILDACVQHGRGSGLSVANWFDSLRVRLRNLWHWRTAWAYRHLVREMKRDADYANTWQCNIACLLMDEGMNHADANRAADRLMRHLFGVKSNT